MGSAVKGLLICVLLLLVCGGLFVGCTYTGTASAFEAKNSAWANVENVYQVRADKLPNLANVTKAYATHERAIFEKFAAARARVDSANQSYQQNKANPDARKEYDAANVQLSTAMMPILTLQERYPELKADKTFTRLMDEISSTENTIRVERKRFNEAVEAYNKKVVFGGRLFGYQREEYYKSVTPGAATAPTIDLQ